MLPDKIAFIDLETTGTRSFYDRIIEVGIVRVENNEIVRTFHSLINPQAYIPHEITMITGITGKDLEDAPTFNAVKDEILETLADCVFVAHNVRFDYSFLRSEMQRENITFNSKHFCTVKLSRALYPGHRHHNLDAIIERFNISCAQRHRALEDAQVLYHFYKRLQSEFKPEILAEAIARTMKRPSLPTKLPANALDNLPEAPGVYIFYGANQISDISSKLQDTNQTEITLSDAPKDNVKTVKKPKKAQDTPDTIDTRSLIPLYVGKSVNIRNRVLSHFSADIRSPIEMKISQQIESIETITTAGELGALFLESQLIKKMLPLYNKRSRIKHELISIKSRLDKNGYQEMYLEPITSIRPDDLDFFYGFYRSKRQAKAYLANIAKHFELCEKMLGLEKTNTACFAYRLGRCKGACAGQEKPIMYNLRVLTAFAGTKILRWPFNGPVLIEEKKSNYETEYFIVDNWCFIGSVKVDGENNKKSDFMENFTFDLDIYKILRGFLKNPNNIKKVKNVTAEDIKLLTNNHIELPKIERQLHNLMPITTSANESII